MNATTKRSLSVALALSAALGLSCVKRAMGPPPEPTNTPIHEPWEDEEAENIALLLSGHLCAPRGLYEQVRSDLAAIRESWGDTLPRLTALRYIPHLIPGQLILGVTGQTFDDMKAGEYHAWDDLNEYYQLDDIDFSHFSPTMLLQFAPRVYSDSLVLAYELLPGVRWVEPNAFGGDGPKIYARRINNGIAYLFRDAWGDCYSGCIFSHYWYYRSNVNGIEFVGSWRPRSGGYEPYPEPDWWKEAKRCIDLYDGPRDRVRSYDAIPPTTITDLRVDSVEENSITISWTAPGNNGMEGLAYRYSLRTSFLPFDDFEPTSGGPQPAEPGTRQSTRITGLTSNTDYYIAIKTVDLSGNWSDVSNMVSTRTPGPVGWNTLRVSGDGRVRLDVQCLAVDASDDLWIATPSGAIRYTGPRWFLYNKENGQLPSNEINAIEVDSGGRVWAATSDGLAVYERPYWTTYNSENSPLPSDDIRSLAVAADGAVWVGTRDGQVVRLNGTDWSIWAVHLPPPHTPGPIQSLTAAPNGDVWCASIGFVARWDGATWDLFSSENSPMWVLDDLRVAASPGGSIWVGHASNLHSALTVFDGQSWRVERSDPRIRFIEFDRVGTLWCTSQDWSARPGMALSLDQTGWHEWTTGNSGLVSSDIRSVAVDRAGIVWFGTALGLCRFDPSVGTQPAGFDFGGGLSDLK